MALALELKEPFKSKVRLLLAPRLVSDRQVEEEERGFRPKRFPDLMKRLKRLVCPPQDVEGSRVPIAKLLERAERLLPPPGECERLRLVHSVDDLARLKFAQCPEGTGCLTVPSQSQADRREEFPAVNIPRGKRDKPSASTERPSRQRIFVSSPASRPASSGAMSAPNSSTARSYQLRAVAESIGPSPYVSVSSRMTRSPSSMAVRPRTEAEARRPSSASQAESRGIASTAQRRFSSRTADLTSSRRRCPFSSMCLRSRSSKILTLAASTRS
jgi:hypothetical protein